MFFNTLCALNDKKQLNYEIHPIQKKLKRDDLIKKIKEEEQNIEVKQEYVEEQIDIKYKHSKNNIDIKKEIEDRIKIEVEEEEKRYAKAVWSIFLSDFKNIHIKENLFIGLTFLKKEIKENLSNQRLYRIQIEEVNKKNNEEIMIENYVKLYLIMQYQIIITFLSLKKHQIFFHHKLLLLFSGSCCGYFSTYREKNFFKNQSYGTSITMRNRFKKYLENVKNQLNIEVDQYESLFKQKVILPNKVLINNREYYEIDKKYYNNIKKTDQFHLISIIETCVEINRLNCLIILDSDNLIYTQEKLDKFNEKISKYSEKIIRTQESNEMMKDLDEFLFDIDRIENIKQEIKQENFTIEDVKEENNNFQRKQQLNTFEILVKKE